jgi:hypothetical protein
MTQTKNTPFPYLVPTSSLIAVHPDDPFQVCVIEQTQKHKGRLTLVGGRVEMHRQNHLQCALEEWGQEAGGLGATLVAPKLWAIKTDAYSDVRPSTLGKLTHGLCSEHLLETPVIGHYGAPDYIYVATVNGTPSPKDGEAKRCLFVDVRSIPCTATEEESRFGAQHDLVLLLYRLHLAGRAVSNADLADFKELRIKLPPFLANLSSSN